MARISTQIGQESIEIIDTTPLLIALSKLKREANQNLGENEDLKRELNSKIDNIVNDTEVKTIVEKVNDLSRIVSKSPEMASGNEIGIMAKKIELATEKLTEKYPREAEELRKKEFEKKFEEETKKLNPNLKTEELEKVKEYGKLLSETYASNNIIDGQKDAALDANNQIFSPGKIQNAWTDLKGVTNFLTKKPEEIKEIKNKFESLKKSLKDVNLPNFKEVNSFENVISSFNSQGLNKTFSEVQRYLGWADRIDKLTGGWLNKTVTETGLKMVSKIGNQAIQEFATNALNVMAEQGFKKGFETVLNGILSGGVKAATTTAASGAAAAGTGAVVAGAEVAAGAAVSATGVGAIVLAALAVVKVLKKIGGKIADTLGINLKKGLQETFGKVGGALINGAIFIVGLPALLIGAISMTLILPLIPIIIGGMFLYNLFNGSLISSLVTPKETIDITDSGSDGYTTDYNYSYISSSGPIVLPQYSAGTIVTGQMIVDMASSLVNKVCYWYGGGHGHCSHSEPVKGIDTYWGTPLCGTNLIYDEETSPRRKIYGLDCSGFVGWVYHQFGININSGAQNEYSWAKIKFTNKNLLQLGDLGCDSGCKHIGIFAGRDNSGNLLWIHDGPSGIFEVCQGKGSQPGGVQMGEYLDFIKFARVL